MESVHFLKFDGVLNCKQISKLDEDKSTCLKGGLDELV